MSVGNTQQLSRVDLWVCIAIRRQISAVRKLGQDAAKIVKFVEAKYLALYRLMVEVHRQLTA